jgi:hypothetical protein
VDERGPIKTKQVAPIHADPPAFVDQSTTPEMLETGIKVILYISDIYFFLCRLLISLLLMLEVVKLASLVVQVWGKLC